MNKQISVQAGDIIASRSNSYTSRLICKLTQSQFSHVAIATSSNTVFEATKKKNVNDMPLDDFLSNNNFAIRFKRPSELSTEQTTYLQAFVSSETGKKYTTLYAGLTGFPGLMSISVALSILAAIFDLVLKNRTHVGTIATDSIALMIFAFCAVTLMSMMIWLYRSEISVSFTEKMYCKTRWGRYIVNKKHNMCFCSQLVLKADQVIGGALSKYVPQEMEVQPKHIVKACRKMGWSPAVLKKTE